MSSWVQVFFFFCADDVCVYVCVCVRAQCRGMRALGRETDSGLSHVRPSCMYSSEPGGEAEANRSIITSEEHSLTDANPRQERGARQKERGREKDRDPLQNQLKPN